MGDMMTPWAAAQQLEPGFADGNQDCDVVMQDIARQSIEPNELTEEQRAARRKGIVAMQNEMLKTPGEIPGVKHYFAPGVYAREMLIPQGKLIVGKIHRHAHLNIISYGSVKVSTEFGPMAFKGPYTFTSQPGTKRVVYAEEDTLWTTIHVTEETDLEKIEDFVIAPSYEAIGMDDPAKLLEGDSK
jgi:hypothetical protein